MTDLDLHGKRILIREDFNVPMEDGRITNDLRIRAALPTIQKALNSDAAVIVISHLGRPEEGKFQNEFSLQPVAKRLGELLNQPVKFIADWQQDIHVQPGEVALLENVRFNVGEKINDEALAKKLGNLADIFVMDAFATAHRAQASTEGVAKFAKVACAGPLLVAEITALNKALENPKRPLIAIVGGAKVSTKFTLLASLLNKVDQLIVGGGIANTLLAAQGISVGKSLMEPEFIDEAKKLLKQAKEKDAEIPLPSDVVVSDKLSSDAFASTKSVNEINAADMILDIGPKTSETLANKLASAGTILWNGPVGVFEYPQFAEGTKKIAHAIANSPAYSIAGGGDTLAAIEQFEIQDKIAYISTGGGAFLEYIEGKTLPGIARLFQK